MATAYVVVAWLIIQVVETIFPAFGFSDKAVRIVVIIFSIGFIPALIAAWVFEFTPDGLRLDKDVDQPSASPRKRSPILDRLIIVFLALGLIYFALDKFVFAPQRAAEREAVVAEQAKAEAIVGYYGDRSIAVLPFVNMSSDAEQEFFAEGISEEILNLLARIRELRVISRSSAFALKGRKLEVPEIADMLGVAHVLEGSVRTSGNTVRVTAQLIEAKTDTHLWSKSYDRELENLFVIQDEIAADVARNMRLNILQPLPNSRVIDPEVRALTQQASQVQEMRQANIGQNMHVLLDRALQIDPDYIPALELIAYADWFLWDDGIISSEDEVARLEATTASILAVDPNNGFVDSIYAFRADNYELDLEKAAGLHTSAIEKDPTDPNIVRLAGAFARGIGRMDESVRILEHVVAIDPLCYQCLYQLSRTYMYAGQYKKAEAARTRYIATGGNGGQYHHSLIKLLQGETDASMRILDDLPDGIQTQAARGAVAYSMGNVADAQAALEYLLASEQPYALRLVTELSAWMNVNDLAFEKLEILQGNFTVFNPLYRNLYDDPRWDDLRDSIGMSQKRLDAIEFKPVLPE